MLILLGVCVYVVTIWNFFSFEVQGKTREGKREWRREKHISSNILLVTLSPQFRELVRQKKKRREKDISSHTGSYRYFIS